MTEATHKALTEIDHILHDAGWEAPSRSISSFNEHHIGVLRNAYQDLLREDHFRILQNTLGKRSSIQEASASMGLSEEEGKKLFAEALQRLTDFVELSEGQVVNHGSV